MRHEHAVMLERTVDLGDECGRPSATILGMLSFWFDLQGQEDASRRAAQRGIDLAASPDDPATGVCWYEFAGATAAIEAFSPAAVEAFGHQKAALANTGNIELEWHSLVNLIDASLHADPSATPALRQRLNDVASTVRSPRLTICVP
jgi:hypothetical protein